MKKSEKEKKCIKKLLRLELILWDTMRQDRRKAVVLLGTGKTVPKELKERLINDTLKHNRQKNKR